MIEDFANALAGNGHGVHDGVPGVKPIPTVVPDPTVFQDASSDGFRALWVVFIVMVLASAFFALMSWNVPVSKRLYHVITTIITITAAISYFAMASGHATAHQCSTVRDHHKHVPDTHHEVCRQIFWARYVDWAITTPLLLLDLCLLAGVDGAHTLMAVVADLIMVLCGLFAAFGQEQSPQRWGWYAIACIAYLFVIWHVVLQGSKSATVQGARVKKLFASITAFTFILWTIYPIVWGVAEGAHRMSVNSEIVAYAVLDILAKPVFGFWLLIAHRKITETNLDVGGWWSHGLGGDGRIRLEEDAA